MYIFIFFIYVFYICLLYTLQFVSRIAAEKCLRWDNVVIIKIGRSGLFTLYLRPLDVYIEVARYLLRAYTLLDIMKNMKYLLKYLIKQHFYLGFLLYVWEQTYE